MNKFLESMGIHAEDVKIYEQAFTHQSYVNENKNLKLNNYERLELLGDSVLQLLTTEFLYKNFTDLDEGELTKLRQLAVRTESIARFATQLKLYEVIKLGKGERDPHRESLLADVFESFLGALYVDGQHEAIVSLLSETVFKALESNEFADNLRNYKAEFQELIQADDRGNIEYIVINSTGPAHQMIFTVNLLVDGIKMGKGKGTTKKEAENFAAKDALSKASL